MSDQTECVTTDLGRTARCLFQYVLP